MNNTLQTKCDLLAENRNLISKGFMLEHSMLKIASALVYTQEGKIADIDYLKECRGILRRNEGIFSDFRGLCELLVSSRLAQKDDPERFMDDIASVYKMLHEGKIFGSRYMVLAAISICDAKRAADAREIIAKTDALLKGMKKQHPFLTSDEDTSFAVLLAMTDKDVETILEELEQNYQNLKKNFMFHDNAVYSLAQVLTMQEGSSNEKCEKAVDIFNAFKDAGAKYGKDYELSSIGALVGMNVEIGEMVADIVEASSFLKEQKGFGGLDISGKTRLMFSALLYAGTFADENAVSKASALESTLAMIITEEIVFMMMMVVMTSSAAANSSH